MRTGTKHNRWGRVKRDDGVKGEKRLEHVICVHLVLQADVCA